MACRYYLNGKESNLYTELYGYLDTVAADKKSAEEVYKILKSNKIATRHNGTWVQQGNHLRDLEANLVEINRINRKYPGLLVAEYRKDTPAQIERQIYKNKLYSLSINEEVLKQIEDDGVSNSDFNFKTEYELENYLRSEHNPANAFSQDYLLDEMALEENKSNQSRVSEMQKEEQVDVERKVTHLKNSFAKAGINVEVIFDEDLDALGQLDAAEEGKNPVIRLNPNRLREDTTIHEFGHIYVDLLGINDPTVAAAISELKGTDLYNKVAQAYPDLKGTELDVEVLVTAIGQEGAKITRKNPSKLQVLLNKIFRAFSKMLGKAGVKATPNSAAILAQEMLSGDLRTADMTKPLRRYSQQSRDLEKITTLVNEVKTRTESEIREIKKLPEEKQELRMDKLRRLKASLEKVRQIEDLNNFVESMAESMDSARAIYDEIMALPEDQRATSENMNKLYEIKKILDSFDAVKGIKSLMKIKKKRGKIKEADQSRFDTMEERIFSILEDAEALEEEFNDDIIPVMADILLPFHNTELDPKIQALIDNVEKHKRIGFNRNELSRDPEYIKLKQQRDKNFITEDEFQEKALKRNIEVLKNKQILGRDALIREMRKAHKDKSAFSFLMDPMIYSSEPLIQMFAKSVKEAEYRKNDMTLDFKYDLKEEYDLFSEGKSESDVAALNEELLEEVTMETWNADGSKNKVKTLTLAQPFLVDKYYEDMSEMYDELDKKYNKPKFEDYATKEEYNEAQNAWRKTNSAKLHTDAVEAWLSDNTEPVDGWIKEKAKLERELDKVYIEMSRALDAGKAEMAAQLELKHESLLRKRRRNLTNNKSIPRGEWVRPKSSKYANPKYQAVQNDPKKKRYYDFTLNKLKEGQQMVGKNNFSKNTWDDFSYVMPSVRKLELDRAREQGLISSTKDMLKENFTTQSTDTEFGVYNEISGELQKSVPVYYTNLEDSKVVSKDIASSLYAFRHMAHNFKAKSEIVGQVMLFRDIIGNRDTLKVDAAGMEMVNGIASQIGIKLPAKEAGESYTYKHIDEWIDMVMFGQSEFQAKFKIGGTEVSANKIAGTLNSYMALNTLSLNILQGTNQVILDNMSMVSEAVAGEFMSTSDLAWAKGQYWKEGAAISDIGKFAPDTKLGKAMELFDAKTEFTDTEGNKLVGGALRKAMSTDNLMFIQQGAEHELSATRMLGLMRAKKGKLKDANGNVLMNENGEPADLYDMLIVDKKGKMSIDPRVANFNKSEFITLLQGLSRRTNQTKGTFDRALLNRRWYGKLAMLFRNWMVPGIRRRYGHGGLSGSTLHVDEEVGSVTQGMYVSFWNLMVESLQKKQVPMTTYRTMTDMEQKNVKRTLVELSSLASAMALVAALSNLDDDEETWVSNFVLYQAKRYEMEILQWTPLVGTKEAFRILKSPTATARPVEQGIALIEQIAFREVPYMLGAPIANDKIFYQRRTGRYQKGDRKLRKKFEDLIPVLRGLRKSQTPGEAAKWFSTLE